MTDEFVHERSFPGGISTCSRPTSRTSPASEQPAAVDQTRAELADGRRVMGVARSALDGPVAVGSHRPRDGVTEIVGVAVLPEFRRRGLAAALTDHLVEDALGRAINVVVLTAESDAVARIYARIGFRRIGTAGVAEA